MRIARWQGCRSLVILLARLVAMLTPVHRAHASLTVLVGEPFGNFGTMMPLGHTAVYLDRVCADGPLKLRLCLPDEPQGVVLSRYHAIGQYDWLATPVMEFFYATRNPADIPAYATAADVWGMRQEFRQTFLQSIVPDGAEGEPDGQGGAKHARSLDEWWETSGMAYQRRFWAYQVATTAQQDAQLVAAMNADPNRHRYHLSAANCADFAAGIVNLYYPGAVKRADRVADYGLMTPKHVVRSLSEFAKHHDDISLHVYDISQVPGSLRRSKAVWGGVEAALKTKRYLFTLLLIQPEVPLVLEALYLKSGRWKIGAGARPAPGSPQMVPQEGLAATVVSSPDEGSQ